MTKRDDSQGLDPLLAKGDAREWTDLDPYREFVRLGSEGIPVALVTVLETTGSAPRSMGAAMTVSHDGSIVGTVGGGGLEREMIKHALDAIRDGCPRRYHYDFSGGKHQNVEIGCSGKADFLIQPCVTQPHLMIFGAGHIGRALAPMGVAAGFRLTVADDRPGQPEPHAFPANAHLCSGDFRETISKLAFDSTTYIVVVTYNHEQDETVLGACLHKEWRYLGMIGSKAKVASIFKSLSVDDESKRLLSRVHAPIGLRLGGRSPGEIAVAIAAELIAVRHRQDQGAAERENTK